MVEKIRFSREGNDYVTNDNVHLGWQKGVFIHRITPTEVILEGPSGPKTTPRDEVVDNYLYRNVEWDG